MPLSSEPFSVPDPLADAWDEMVRQNRMLQAQNNPLSGDRESVPPPGERGDAWIGQSDVPIDQWMALRRHQLSPPPHGAPMIADLVGGPSTGASLRGAMSTAGAPLTPTAARRSFAQTTLTGRPGTAAKIARTVNTITSRPNSSTTIDTDGVQATIRRGAGKDIIARGKFDGTVPFEASGQLDPSANPAEVDLSGVKLRGPFGIPAGNVPHLRIYNTPTGELDIDLPSDVRLGPKTVTHGVYVLGAPDRPRSRR